MAQLELHHLATLREDPPTAPLAPLTIIRTETVLSRLPIHNLAKKGRVQIKITRKNPQGEIDLYWQVSPNPAYGEPRHLAYKLDTIVINQRIHALGRPLPKVLRLGSIAQICRDLEVVIGGSGHASVKQAFLQNAATFLTAKLRYTATDGMERTLEAGFTRYSVVFTGERLPDGTIADAVYLILNDPYWEVLNHAPIRPLDYDYLQALPPAAQRCYEIISYILFAALKYGHAEAKLLYSEYCTFSAQQRYADYPHVKKQMYKVHKPHLTSGYLARVRYEATTDAEGHPDWVMYYVPGPKARAEYAAFNGRPRRRPPRAPATPLGAVAEEATPDGVAEEAAPAPPRTRRCTSRRRRSCSTFTSAFTARPTSPPAPGSSRRRATCWRSTAWTRRATSWTSASPRRTRPTTARKPLAASSSTRPARSPTTRRPNSASQRRRGRATSGTARRRPSTSASSMRRIAPRTWPRCGSPRRLRSSPPLRRPPPPTSSRTIPAASGVTACAGSPSTRPWQRIFSSRPLPNGRPPRGGANAGHLDVARVGGATTCRAPGAAQACCSTSCTPHVVLSPPRPPDPGDLSHCRLQAGAGPLWVCEGACDALALLAVGVPRVVALFGVQGRRCAWAREVRELVFALDADAAGQQQWRQLARQAALRGKRVAVLPAAAYGGCKDVSEAWEAGGLRLGTSPFKVSQSLLFAP
jgi:hypothetical protein